MNPMDGIALETAAIMLVVVPLLSILACCLVDVFRRDRHAGRYNARLADTLERR